MFFGQNFAFIVTYQIVIERENVLIKIRLIWSFMLLRKNFYEKANVGI